MKNKKDAVSSSCIHKSVAKLGLFLGAIAVTIGGMLSYMGAFNTSNNQETSKTSTNYNYSGTAYFSGGCFWCMESIFEKQDGVEGAYAANKFSELELKEMLTPLEYKVTQEKGTEPAFKNEYWDNKLPGIYVDILEGTPLYSSLDKFDSGTGWPSFTKSIDEDNIVLDIDTRFFMTRTEVSSATSGSHLGHIFNDAPAELGGIRHCINSASLRFVPVENLEQEGYGDYEEMFN